MPRSPRLHAQSLDDRIVPTLAALDPLFGTAGLAHFPPPVLPSAGAHLAVAADGSSFVAIAVPGTGGTADFAIVKLNPSGAVDTTFGTNGSTVIPFDKGGDNADLPEGIALGPEGTILVAGTISIGGSNTDWGVCRLLATGKLDSSFGANGQAMVAFDLGGSNADTAAGVAVLPDGRVVLGGTVTRDGTGNTDFAAARLTLAGLPDPSFNGTGTSIILFDLGGSKADVVRAFHAYADGRVILAGSTQRASAGDTDFAVARLTSGGLADPGFGAGKTGRAVVPVDGGGSNADVATGIAVQADGRIVLGGWAQRAVGGDVDFAAARFGANGVIDSAFGIAGRITIPVNLNGQSEDRATSITLDARGRTILVGSAATVTGSEPAVVRLTPSGQPDPAFSKGGAFSFPVNVVANGDDRGSSIAVRPNGRIVVAGTVQTGASESQAALFQLNADLGLANTVVVSGEANGVVRLFGSTLPGVDPGLSSQGLLSAIPGFSGVVRGVSADITGDGVPDQIYGVGPGGGSLLRAVDGATGTELVPPTAVYEAGFTGGIFVAAGDLDRDGKAEIAVSPDQGGGGRVVIFRYSGTALVRRDDFFGIEDPNFRGGARVAFGDLTGDGRAELLVGAGFSGGPRVAIFAGSGLLQNQVAPPKLLGDFFAFPGPDAITLRNGVFVATADVNGDGQADVAFGGGPGGGPRIFLLSGAMLAAGNVTGAQAAPLANFFVDEDGTQRGGVRLAFKDLDGDDRAELLAASGDNQPSQFRIYRGAAFPSTNGQEPDVSQVLDPFSAVVPNGVFVG